MGRETGGSAPKPPRFIALGPYGWKKRRPSNKHPVSILMAFISALGSLLSVALSSE